MPNKFIVILSSNEDAKVQVSDVILIERDRRKLYIVTEDHKYEYYEKLDNVKPLLDGRFFPCIKSCYVNFDRVERMAEQCIYFDNGQVFHLGRENFMRTRHQYKEYMKKMSKKPCENQ